MVYCTKCGAKNEEDAQVCGQCGASLYRVLPMRYERRIEEGCFGLPQGGAIAGAVFGVIIILAGIILFLQQTGVIEKGLEIIGPLIVIILGILILAGGLYGLRRRY